MYVPTDEVIYGLLKANMPPVPAIFKMAINTAFVLIRKDAEKEKSEHGQDENPN